MKEKYLSLSEGKRLIEELEKIEQLETLNILKILPEVHKGYDFNTVTNFFLQLRMRDKHYFLFIEEELKKIKELDKFNADMQHDKIYLKHKKGGKYHFTWYPETIEIDYFNKTYTLKHIEDSKVTYNGLIKEREEKPKERTSYDDLMDVVKEYLDKPCLKNRLKIAKSSGPFFVAVSNFFTDIETMKELYEKYTNSNIRDLEHEESMKKDREEIKEWLDTVFQEILEDCNELAKYLSSLGYIEVRG